MTLLNFLGLDDTIAQVGQPVGGSIAGRTGGQAQRRGTTTLSDFVNIPTNPTGIVFGVAVRWGAISASTFLRFLDSGGNVHLTLQITATGEIILLGPAGTQVATTTGLGLITATWYYIECKATIADAGGTVEVKVNEISKLTFTGDTRNAGTGNVAKVQNAGTSSNTDFDDVYVLDLVDATGTQGAPNNNYLGDCVVTTALPTGDGASSQWTGSDGNSVNNSLLVDEPTTPSATDYVGASAAGLTDLYAMADVAATSAVLGYKVLTFAAKSDAGSPPVMKPATRGNAGTVREHAALSLTTTYQLFPSAIETTDPDGNALNATRFNAMQAGVRSA